MMNEDSNVSGIRQGVGAEEQPVRFHRVPCLQSAHKEMLEWPVVAVSASMTLAAILVYSVTGPVFTDNMYRIPRRLMLTALCSVIAWPFWYSTTAMLLFVVRRMQPSLILTMCAASMLVMPMPFVALGYAAAELVGLNAPAFLEIYLNAVAWVAACTAILLYTVCVRVRLRHAADAMLTGTPASGHPVVETILDAPSSADDGHSVGISSPREAADANLAARADVDTGQHRPTGSHGTTELHAPFLDRLPRKLGRDLIYLHVSGHYVNAVTTEGSGVILMRFADAVAELGDMGIQVHRSYWVAHAHVTGVFRRDERTFVRVTGGHEVPVSRTHLAAVRELMPRIARGSQPGLARILTTSD